MSLQTIALGAGIFWYAWALASAAGGEHTPIGRRVRDVTAAQAGSTRSRGRWSVRATLTAGEVPGGETVDLDSSGHMADENTVLKFQCVVDLVPSARTAIESAILGARPEMWREKYFPPSNPDGSDELQMVLYLIRVERDGRSSTYRTRWMIATGADAPADAIAVWNAVWQARRFCLMQK